MQNVAKLHLEFQETTIKGDLLFLVFPKLISEATIIKVFLTERDEQSNQFILDDQSYEVIDNPNTNYELFEEIKPSIRQLNLNFHQENINFCENAYKLAKGFQYLPQLQILKLQITNQHVSLDQYKQIFLDLSKLQELTQIDLLICDNMSSTQIVGDGFQDSEIFVQEIQLNNLAKSISFAQSLQSFYLDITNLQIQDEFVLKLGQSLSKLASINELRLHFSENKITDKGISSICFAIEQLMQLEQISISLQNNYITESGYLHLKNSLQKKITLKNLDQDFKWNRDELNIPNNFAEILVFENNSIRNLELNLRVFNQLNQNIVDQIAKSIQQSKNIETLIIDAEKSFFTLSSSKKPLPVSDLKQLKRLIIFSDLSHDENRQVKKYIVRKSLRLIELIITNYF
ncbi:LMBR1-like motif protein (macronuclear) [Tetrahymena thermophila SB210]|uniref:LMBR1-like motif protein n=1 Tax=Tetrahymena thermophila (strain SB210) TaxID=312017 RepID=W7X8M5_TETTS|nr:LMBR1-like motif protein [Tetrahymena thermophila SB210]EWS72758.1 LMBR1-like motif protein [Tetrahymena thermophila SB210]|eukprot:XP_012654695.1 LMBR1-like motif protein [Tetrahymena thermophila SB210]